MYVKTTMAIGIIIVFAWRDLAIFTILSITVCYLYLEMGIKEIGIPFLPLGTLGTAVAILLGFRNNSAYDRFWEARQIWGGITNASRTFARQITTLVTLTHIKKNDIATSELHLFHREMIYRHLAYINALRLHLRKEDMINPNCWYELAGFITDNEIENLEKKHNKPTQLIQKQAERLKYAQDMGLVEDFRHIQLDNTLTEFYNLQGRCERIKNTPLPRQYAFFTYIFTWIFILLLPFSFVKELGDWVAVPLTVLVSWIFATLQQVGKYTENPFDNTLNDVPMSAICRNIEIDLREQLGETTHLKPLEPIKGILM